MPVDNIYWNSIDFGSEDGSIHGDFKNYVDPWDLENYAYIQQHLIDSIDLSEPISSDELTETNSTSFCYVPVKRRDQNYADIEEVQKVAKKHHDWYEFDENPYEVNVKDISSPYGYYDHTTRARPVPIPDHRKSKDRRSSFSHGDYCTNQDIYSRLEEVRPRKDQILPTHDDVGQRHQPRNFGRSNYGHLKIDYSYNWNTLDKYICN